MAKGFYFDMTACIGCRTCQIACKDKNNLDVGTVFRKVTTFETGSFPRPGVYHYSGTCNHCENPRCVDACPTRAMHKLENGIVDHDKTKCIGCRNCMWNCPYGVPQYIEKIGKVSKCDMCKDLLAKGQNPACVDSCLMRIIECGDLDALKSKYPATTSDLPILPRSSLTNPSVLVKAKAIAQQEDFRKKEV